MIEVIAFDADDTLWYTGSLYVMAQGRFTQILAQYDIYSDIDTRLSELKHTRTSLQVFSKTVLRYLASQDFWNDVV